MLPIQEISSTFDMMVLYTSCIGFIFALIVAITITSNVVINYYSIFYSVHSNRPSTAQQSKCGFILILLYCGAVIISSLSFGFIFSNLFTGIEPSTFTGNQCVLGYVLFYSVVYFCNIMLYILFTWRIQKSFQLSSYNYPQCLYISIYVISILLWLSWSIYLIFNRGMWYDDNFKTFEISYIEFESSPFAYCNSIFVSSPKLRSIMISGLGAINFILMIILLYMFNRGLWMTNKLLMKVYVRDHVDASIHSIVNSTETQTIQTQTQTLSPPSAPVHMEKASSTSANEDLKVIVDTYDSERKDADISVKRIINLHNLIKKQTILVCIAVISTTLIGSLAAVDPKMGLEIGWDFGINLICAWMMLSTSKRCWHCCTHYGICKCCYLKTGKN